MTERPSQSYGNKSSSKSHNLFMSANSAIAPPTAKWDLTSLFSGIEDPRIAALWTEVTRRTDEYATQYRGTVSTLSPDALCAALKTLEDLSQDLYKPVSFANLLFSADSSDPKIAAFMQEQQLKASEIRVKLMFFDLELQAADAATADAWLSDNVLSNYHHTISVTRAMSPYMLTEKEEVILEEVSNTGSRAWTRYFEEVTAKQVFKYTAPGATEAQDMTEEQVLNLLRSADRAVRQAAADSFTQGLKEMEHAATFTYNMLLLDKSVEDRLRSFTNPEDSRHLANELDKPTVDAVVEACRAGYPVVARYYNTKKKLLGLPELTHIDRYAPLSESTIETSYEDARDLILEAFGEFHPTLQNRCAEFFEKSWIDAEPRKGKGGGAFCSGITPDTHPVIMMTYLNKAKDVGTLAHELGHGVHYSLSRKQSLYNYHATLPLAELASIFAEMMVFEKQIASASLEDQVAMYAEKIEGMFASVFRQIAMFSFERRAHAARREQGELTQDDLGEIWQEELQAMFGDSVKLGEDHKRWWTYVWHFYGVPFYVYAYAFGELLTLSLYDQSKREGAAFASKYVELLEMGGSKTPHELIGTLGVNLRDKAFWEGGIRIIERFVGRFEELVAQL